MTHAYGYMLNFGEEEQPQSLKSQEESIVSYFNRKLAGEFQFAGVYGDYADSMRLPFLDRLGARALLKRLQRGDAIVFSRLEVAFYKRSDLLQMLSGTVEAHRAALYFVEESIQVTDRETAHTIVQLIYYADRVADEPRRREIRKSLNERRARGLPPNGEAGLGFKLVGTGVTQKIVADEIERAAMKRIFELRQSGMPFSEIRLFLRKEGVRFRRKVRGKWEEREWSESRIRRAYEAFLKLRQPAAEPTELKSG